MAKDAREGRFKYKVRQIRMRTTVNLELKEQRHLPLSIRKWNGGFLEEKNY